MEVDVRGMTLDEAIAAVDIYLADATLAGLNEVSIIPWQGHRACCAPASSAICART